MVRYALRTVITSAMAAWGAVRVVLYVERWLKPAEVNGAHNGVDGATLWSRRWEGDENVPAQRVWG